MQIFLITSIVVAYVAVGLLWCVSWWSLFVRRELSYYESCRKSFMTRFRLRGEEIPEYLRFTWREVVSKDPRLSQIPPVAADHTTTFVLNVVFWPFAMLSIPVQAVYRRSKAALSSWYRQNIGRQRDLIRKDLQ